MLPGGHSACSLVDYVGKPTDNRLARAERATAQSASWRSVPRTHHHPQVLFRPVVGAAVWNPQPRRAARIYAFASPWAQRFCAPQAVCPNRYRSERPTRSRISRNYTGWSLPRNSCRDVATLVPGRHKPAGILCAAKRGRVVYGSARAVGIPPWRACLAIAGSPGLLRRGVFARQCTLR
jgi:hypothetical protein